MKVLLYLIAGGSAGTLVRFGVSEFFKRLSLDCVFPLGTLFVNLAGCFILGFVASRFQGKLEFQLALAVGFCGALTTFSTFIMELAQQMNSGQTLKAFIYLMLSVMAGFILFRAGVWVASS